MAIELSARERFNRQFDTLTPHEMLMLFGMFERASAKCAAQLDGRDPVFTQYWDMGAELDTLAVDFYHLLFETLNGVFGTHEHFYMTDSRIYWPEPAGGWTRLY